LSVRHPILAASPAKSRDIASVCASMAACTFLQAGTRSRARHANNRREFTQDSPQTENRMDRFITRVGLRDHSQAQVGPAS
jgi:hypothetical protein